MATDLTPVTSIENFLAAANVAAGRDVLRTIFARSFDVLADDAPVTYQHGAVRFTANNSQFPLPAPDEGQIGAAWLVYGPPDGTGYLYAATNCIKTPRRALTNYYAVKGNECVLVQLDSDGNYRISPIYSGERMNLGALSGSLSLNYENGEYQYGYTSGDITVTAPAGMVKGDVFFLEISYVNAATTLSFSGVDMPSAASALLPFALVVGKSYLISMRHKGGQVTLETFLGPDASADY